MPCGMTLDDFLPLRFPPTLKDRLGHFYISSSGFSTPCHMALPGVFKHGISVGCAAHKIISQTYDGLSLPSLDALRRLFERSES